MEQSNFNVQFRLENHSESVFCSTKLKDGRFATGSKDKSIIIYNKKTFKPDLTIKERNDFVICIIQLSSGELASSSNDRTIKIYNINENEYQVIQILEYHTDSIWKILELKNKQLISCSRDNSMIFYCKNNNKYIKDYSISTNGLNGPVIHVNDDEICFGEQSNICFYNLIERKIISIINNIHFSSYSNDTLIMITKDLLLVAGRDILSIINVNSHNLIRIINVVNSSYIYCTCLLNENMLLTGDFNKRILIWKIEGDNLRLISKKENAHDNSIFTLLKLGNDQILSGSDDNFAKIWKLKDN